VRPVYQTLILVLIQLRQTFRVHWRDEGSKVDTAAYITLDGYKVPGRYLWGKGETSRGGIRTGPNTERPFTFDNFDEPEGSLLSCASTRASLTKSRVGRYRTWPHSGSKGTWNNRASHPAHLLDPSRRAEPCSSDSASCGRGGGRHRPSCRVSPAFNKPYDSHMRAIGLDHQCLRCHKPQLYHSNRMTRQIRVPT
jgi:hypothetical protein